MYPGHHLGTLRGLPTLTDPPDRTPPHTLNRQPKQQPYVGILDAGDRPKASKSVLYGIVNNNDTPDRLQTACW